MAVQHLTVADRVERGRAVRERLPVAALGELWLPPSRSDPVALIDAQNRTRLPELLDLRFARMSPTPFTFFRGAAAVMAADLAAQPSTGLEAQLCGDAHLSNFGVFGTPERRLTFDINDFDETSPGPWEWDAKRLAVSLAVAGRVNGFSRSQRRTVVRRSAEAYRRAMREFATMRTLDVWYAGVDVEHLAALRKLQAEERKRTRAALLRARARDSRQVVDRLTVSVEGRRWFRADPPVLVPLRDLLPADERHELEGGLQTLLGLYRETLAAERQHLLDHFAVVDLARVVPGVGSVGTRCWLVLLEGRDESDPLVLQVKEAQRSVVRQGPSEAAAVHEGARVVAGQRLMQAVSDIFLGWQRFSGLDGVDRDFYVRQYRDWKLSAKVERMTPRSMAEYGGLCAWTLAKAHARSGDPVAVAAYLGRKDRFERALVELAERYADQNERDHARFVEAQRLR